MKEIDVKTKSITKVVVGDNLLKDAGNLISRYVTGRRAFIITDKNVKALYLKDVANSLKKSGFEVKSYAITPGESSKTLKTVNLLYEKAAAYKITRADVIIALGGGVVGDIAGFVAATYLRGVALVQIPTTLLAQVDSSIGGKCGVDTSFGKNSVGCIYQPKLVITSVNTLNTLKQKIFNDGMAEVIKYTFIAGNKFKLTNNLEQLVIASIMTKKYFVESDEHDTGLRMILNFGHTFGHAIEKIGGYKEYTHGQAISMGMVIAAKVGTYLKITPEGVTDIVVNALAKNKLPIACPYNSKEIAENMIFDKKMGGTTLNLILLNSKSSAVILKTSLSELKKVMEQVL